jgi:hypothetical protein
MLKVEWPVSIAIGVICSGLMVRIVWSLKAITCGHSATHAQVGKRLRHEANSPWRLGRAWALFELYTTPGGRYFNVLEFVREAVEAVLQMSAVAEYANNGVGRVFLTVYVVIIWLNSFGVVLLMLPTLVGRNSRWSTGNTSPQKRALLERGVLLLDVVCDALCKYIVVGRALSSLVVVVVVVVVVMWQCVGECERGGEGRVQWRRVMKVSLRYLKAHTYTYQPY